MTYDKKQNQTQIKQKTKQTNEENIFEIILHDKISMEGLI